MAPGYSSELMHVFLATDLIPDSLPQDDDEFIEILRLPLAEVMQMARKGEINDGKTLSSLLLAQTYLQA
jgi:ADP-ribose pyrophosphatase